MSLNYNQMIKIKEEAYIAETSGAERLICSSGLNPFAFLAIE